MCGFPPVLGRRILRALPCFPGLLSVCTYPAAARTLHRHLLCSRHLPTRYPPPPSTQVHYVIDEIIVGGLVMETNMADILAALQTSKREELASAGGGTGLAAGVASSFGGNFIKK